MRPRESDEKAVGGTVRTFDLHSTGNPVPGNQESCLAPSETTGNWVSPWLSRHISSQYIPTSSTQIDERRGKFTTTRPTCYVSKHTMVYDEGEWGMCSAPTRRMSKVRPSINSPHRVVILHQTPEYQYHRFHFYCASLFPFSSMLDAASSALTAAVGSSSYILIMNPRDLESEILRNKAHKHSTTLNNNMMWTCYEQVKKKYRRTRGRRLTGLSLFCEKRRHCLPAQPYQQG